MIKVFNKFITFEIFCECPFTLNYVNGRMFVCYGSQKTSFTVGYINENLPTENK